MSFELDIRNFTNKIKDQAGDTVRKTTLATYGGVMRGTRVDTGRARANWNVNLGSIDHDLNNRSFVTGKKDSLEGTNPNGSEERESGLVRTSLQLKAGQINDVYISNSLDYIDDLEEKDHMMAETVQDVKKKIEAGALL